MLFDHAGQHTHVHADNQCTSGCIHPVLQVYNKLGLVRTEGPDGQVLEYIEKPIRGQNISAFAAAPSAEHLAAVGAQAGEGKEVRKVNGQGGRCKTAYQW